MSWLKSRMQPRDAAMPTQQHTPIAEHGSISSAAKSLCARSRPSHGSCAPLPGRHPPHSVALGRTNYRTSGGLLLEGERFAGCPLAEGGPALGALRHY
jgi:hypothetical protein